MESFFSETGIRLSDFIQISTLFLVTLLAFFNVKEKRYFWINYLLLVTFVLQCVFVILFRDGLPVKLFAALMLTSTVTVELIVNRKRKLQA